MKASIKKRWVAALRSGKYKQGMGDLRREGFKEGEHEYCCLGVLCDLHSKTKEGRKWNDRTYGRADTSLLPQSVQTWAGLKVDDPEVAGRSLSGWNDSEHASFKRIATLIEKHL